METPTFCPSNCEFLNMNEEQQNAHPGDIRLPHWCEKHNKRLLHAGHHPNIVRAEECDQPIYVIGCDMATGADQSVVFKLNLDNEGEISYKQIK